VSAKIAVINVVILMRAYRLNHKLSIMFDVFSVFNFNLKMRRYAGPEQLAV